MKIRTRRFSGRCARHKRFNPAVDGREGIVKECPRCALLTDIWETAIRLNVLIRKFDPKHDDLRQAAKPVHDDRQMSLLEGSFE